jgi:hypothetical protein
MAGAAAAALLAATRVIAALVAACRVRRIAPATALRAS